MIFRGFWITVVPRVPVAPVTDETATDEISLATDTAVDGTRKES